MVIQSHNLIFCSQHQKCQQPRAPSPLVLEETTEQGSPPLSPSIKVGQAPKPASFSSLPDSWANDSPGEAATRPLLLSAIPSALLSANL